MTSITIKNLHYALPPSRNSKLSNKTILTKVSADISPASMTALMGPSGAGKSTLLDIISCRKNDGTVRGDVLFNNKSIFSSPRPIQSFARSIAYVLQDDLHMGTLTVFETLDFAARLKLDDSFGLKERKDRVEKMISMLGLCKVRDSLVGDSFIKGISGGQLKRLSIGVEAISIPDVIFLDEPTSGLDSAIALEVMTAVKAIVNEEKRTCLATIHQPSAEVFQLFDGLILLSSGQIIFSGIATAAPRYFQGLGYMCDSTTNPAEFIIDVAGGALCQDPDTRKSGSMQSPLRAADKSFGNSHVKTPEQLSRLFQTFDADNEAGNAAGIIDRVYLDNDGQTKNLRYSTWKRTKVLIERGFLNNKRNVAYTRAQILKNVIVGAIVGLIFFRQGTMDESVFDHENKLPSASGYNVCSILYFAMLYCITGNIQAIPQLCAARLQFLRERDAGSYTTIPFWLSGLIVYLPLIILTHFLFVNLTYWLIGLPADPRTLSYLFFILTLVNLTSFYVAQLLSALCSSSQVALALFPITFMFLSNFAGFTILLKNVQNFWAWAPYVAFPRYAYEGLVAVTFNDAQPDDYEELLKYFGFENWQPVYSILVLVPYMVTIAFFVLLALLPAKSKLKIDKNAGYSKGDDDVEYNGDDGKTLGDELKSPLLSDMLDDLDSSGADNDIFDPAFRHTSTTGTLTVDSRELPMGDPQGRRGSWNVSDFKRNSDGLENIVNMNTSGDVISLTFSDISYAVKVKSDHGGASEDGYLTILNGVSGRIQPGEMVALMGASGAGKSTLLDLVAGRKKADKNTLISGDIFFNGGPPTRSLMRRTTYVTQDNVHLESLTVHQTLSFAAALRMSDSHESKRAERVMLIAKMLGLDTILDSTVGGSALRGISGGQLKRLSVAVEIMHLPAVIFLDEPTTGLDSQIAHEVMCAVRNLADQNRTVITTIHQPSPATFNLFDKLLLLSNGRTTFFGPVDEAADYFGNLGYTFDRDRIGANVADFVVSVAGGFSEPCLNAVALSHHFNESEDYRHFMDSFEDNLRLDAENAAAAELKCVFPSRASKKYPRSLRSQCIILARRQILKTMQNPKPIVAGVARQVAVALFYGSIYHNLKNDQILERSSLCFFTVMFVVLGHQQSIPIVFDERLLFYRERAAKVYGDFGYFLTGGVAIFPINMVYCFIFVFVLYFLTGFRRTFEAVAFFFVVVAACSACGLFYCQLLACLCPSQQTAITLFPATLFFFIAFAGYIIFIPSLPEWLSSWAPSISFVRWGFQALMINEFKGNEEVFPPIKVHHRTISTDERYEEFAETYGFEGYEKWDSMIYLAINALVFRIGTFLALHYVKHEKR